MKEWKEGDTAWVSATWTKTKRRTKVFAQIIEVTIRQILDDGKCLTTDDEDVGYYADVTDLFPLKEQAALNAMNGIKKWMDYQDTLGEQE